MTNKTKARAVVRSDKGISHSRMILRCGRGSWGAMGCSVGVIMVAFKRGKSA
jgi:hypothetical protein